MKQTANRQRTERQEEELDLINISREGHDKESAGRHRTEKTSYRNRTAEKVRIREKRRKRRKRKRMIRILFLLVLTGLLTLFLFLLLRNIAGKKELESTLSSQILFKEDRAEKPEITVELLTPNPYSRPQTKLKKVKNIFVHYTANKDTSAEQNRSYFENLGITGETSASAHFIISYDGTIIQCLPLDEMGYAVKTRNEDSISIECCYQSEDGKFTEETYQSLLKLSAWLLSEYHLKPSDMRRHYDEGGKKCPLYYVEHQDAWEQFLTDLENFC